MYELHCEDIKIMYRLHWSRFYKTSYLAWTEFAYVLNEAEGLWVLVLVCLTIKNKREIAEINSSISTIPTGNIKAICTAVMETLISLLPVIVTPITMIILPI